MPVKVQVNCYLEHDLNRQIESFAAMTRKHKSDVLHLAVREFVEAHIPNVPATSDDHRIAGSPSRVFDPMTVSERDLQILRFVRTYRSSHNSGPGLRAIAEVIGPTSTSVAAYHVKGLLKRHLLHGEFIPSRDGSMLRTGSLIVPPEIAVQLPKES